MQDLDFFQQAHELAADGLDLVTLPPALQRFDASLERGKLALKLHGGLSPPLAGLGAGCKKIALTGVPLRLRPLCHSAASLIRQMFAGGLVLARAPELDAARVR